MSAKEKIRWITYTAVFVALLMVTQAVTGQLGNTILTGSAVNLMLIVSVMTCGAASGVSVAVLSPILAKLVGIGPLWSLIPFIVTGNIVFVLIWHFIGNRRLGHPFGSKIAALVIAAGIKFLVLYFGIVHGAIPLFLNLTSQQAAVISNMFSFPQLLTALLGGAAALLVLPVLKRAKIGGAL